MYEQIRLALNDIRQPVMCPPLVASQGLELPMGPSCQNLVDVAQGGIDPQPSRLRRSPPRADRRADLLDAYRSQGRNAEHGAELLGSLGDRPFTVVMEQPL
jgi:hypothetical protein